MKGKQRASGKSLTASLAGFECVVQTQVMKKGDTDAAANGWWGYDTAVARSADFLVSHVSIRHHKQRIAVPVSAYSGLANVDKVSIRKTGAGCEISFEGGDGVTSYMAKLFIKRVGKDYIVKQREVRRGEAPQDWWETTTYSDPFSF